MTFSFIVPVYNVEKYLEKCLDSLLAQTCKDFEIIVVNDGSPDNSQSIIDAYSEKYPDIIKGYIKENGGLSDARNFGVERASGDYIAFVDSDDYVAADMLEKLKELIGEDKPDVVGFDFVDVDENGEVLNITTKPEIRNLSGEDAIIALMEHKQMFETAWGYVYLREYWLKMGFAYMKGIYHEDYALTPNVILRAGKVSTLRHNVYYYLIRQGSITNVQSEERIRKLASDMLTGYDFLESELQRHPAKNDFAAKMYMAYAVNSLLAKFEKLEGETRAWFRGELRRRNVAKHIASNNLKRKIRKIYIRLKNKI